MDINQESNKQSDKNEAGRPEISDDQYRTWLEDMQPFLKQGYSLWKSIEFCGLINRKDSIYRKYKENDWFCEKIEAYRATIGEIANNIVFRIISRLHVRLIASDGYSPAKEEIEVLKLVIDRHRAVQPFFANKYELATIEKEESSKIERTPTINYIVPKKTKDN